MDKHNQYLMAEAKIQTSQKLDAFIDHLWLEDGLSKNTLESYRIDLIQFSNWLTTEKTALIDANQMHIQQYLAAKFPQQKPRSIGRLIASMRRSIVIACERA
jgi:Site-specific recombinase XerD